MSKFQSFASQGSFRDYQLQAPDEAAKIKEETVRVISGREKAEKFRQGNADLYLQAQKLAQQQEALSRQTNYELETNSRRLYKEALDRDNRIQIENDRVRAEQQQNTFKQLSDLSQTASKMFVDFNTKLTKNQTDANTVNTILAGTTFEQNLAIQGMIDNLTEAEFAQQGFIQQMVKEGKDVKALWTLYNNRNTRGFIENAGVIQNTSYSLAPYLSEVLKNLDSELTPEQKRLQVETAYREWIANSFKDANGKQLNPKLVANIGAPIFGQAYNQLMGEFDKEEKKANQQKLSEDRARVRNTARANGGTAAVMAMSKGREQLGYTVDWLLDGLKAGTISPEEAAQYPIHPIIDENNKPTNWETKHPTDPNLGRLQEGIRAAHKNRRDDAKLAEEAEKNQLNSDLLDFYNTTVAPDGRVSKAERLQAEQMIRDRGLLNYNTDLFEKLFVQQEDSVRGEAVIVAGLTRKANLQILTRDDLNTKNISASTRDKFLKLLEKQEKYKNSPERKTTLDTINNLLVSNKALVNKTGWTVEEMKTLLAQDLDRLKEEYGFETAKQLVIEKAQNASISPDGHFTEVLDKFNKDKKNSLLSLKTGEEFFGALRNPEIRNNPTELANVLGAGFVYKAYENASSGKPYDPLIIQGAQALRISPLAFVNYLASGANNPEMPPITVDSQIEALLEAAPPIIQNVRNTFSTSNRKERANYFTPGINRGGSIPVRSSIAGVAPTGVNTGTIITDSRDGASGTDFVVKGGERGAPYYFPLEGKVLKVINNFTDEYRLEEGDQRRNFGNLVEVQVTIPKLNNRVVDMLFAHFDQVNNLKPGDTIPSNTLLGTQGRTGSTTGAHVSFDCYVPGTNIPDSVCRDWFRDNYIK